MDKFLFTDGTSGVKEAGSEEELQTLAEQAAAPAQARVWLFNSNEWVSYAHYRKLYPVPAKQGLSPATEVALAQARESAGGKWLKKFLFAALLATGALLVFNFTSVKWEKAAPLHVTAPRPDNVPLMDIDSLISVIEFQREKQLDRSTRTNLRLRNSWPERITLELRADKETSGNSSRYSNLDISIDNSTGFNLDRAIVELQYWKNGKVQASDTLQFNNLRYDKLLVRKLETVFRCDSLSALFQSIKAKAFNFCYSAKIRNDLAAYYDRWFCRDSNE